MAPCHHAIDAGWLARQILDGIIALWEHGLENPGYFSDDLPISNGHRYHKTTII